MAKKATKNRAVYHFLIEITFRIPLFVKLLNFDSNKKTSLIWTNRSGLFQENDHEDFSFGLTFM